MSQQGKRRSGVAAVEFAIIAPVVVFLFAGMVELSRAVQVKHVLSDAARSSARYGIQPGTDTATVTAQAKTILTDNNLDATKATVTVKVNDNSSTDVKNAQRGDKITVQVSIPAGQIGWIAPIFVKGDQAISDTVVMLRQF